MLSPCYKVDNSNRVVVDYLEEIRDLIAQCFKYELN